MSEKTFTDVEVGEMFGIVADALDKGAQMFGAMIAAVPELEKSKTAAEWVKVFATENVKQIRELQKIIEKE